MIKALLVDFGGVLSKEPFFARVAESLGEKYNFSKEKILENLKFHEKGFIEGETSTQEYFEKVCAGSSITKDGFVKALIHYDINEELVEILKKLKEKYTIILVTDNYEPLYEKIQKEADLLELFEKSFYSNKLCKSKLYHAKEFFEIVTHECGFLPEECLFIDNSKRNISFARELGFQCLLFKDNESRMEEMEVFLQQ